jgi:hypothetical protein
MPQVIGGSGGAAIVRTVDATVETLKVIDKTKVDMSTNDLKPSGAA